MIADDNISDHDEECPECGKEALLHECHNCGYYYCRTCLRRVLGLLICPECLGEEGLE